MPAKSVAAPAGMDTGRVHPSGSTTSNVKVARLTDPSKFAICQLDSTMSGATNKLGARDSPKLTVNEIGSSAKESVPLAGTSYGMAGTGCDRQIKNSVGMVRALELCGVSRNKWYHKRKGPGADWRRGRPDDALT